MIELEGSYAKVYHHIRTFSANIHQLTFDKLYSICCKELSISNIEVKEALDFLYSNRYIVENSRLYFKEDLLKNETRKAIYLLIKARPGIYFTKILKILDIGPHVARWHINILKKFRYIRENKFTRYKVFFLSESPAEWDVKFSILSNDTTTSIFRKFFNHSILTIAELSESLDLHYTTIQYHLTKLQNAELIVETREAGLLKYTLTSNSPEFLAHFKQSLDRE